MSEAEEKKIIGKTALEHFETETFAVPDIEGHERRKRRRRGSTLNGSRVLPTDHEPDAGEASKVQAEVIQYPCLKRLLLAVVLRAVDDFRQNPQDQFLKDWLSGDGLFILEAYEQPVAASAWEAFVKAGCVGKSGGGK